MNVLIGIQNFLNFINENWVMIASIITAVIVVAKKVKSYFSLSQEEQIEVAKTHIREIMLMLVTEAEQDYLQWVSAGAVKRAQVIDQIFAMYPILSKVTNQEALIYWIDCVIDDALKTMRKIFEENKAKTESVSANEAL